MCSVLLQNKAKIYCSLNSPSVGEFVHQMAYRSGLLGNFGESYEWKETKKKK